MRKIINFFKEVVAELKKVVWPSRKDAIRYTVQVIVFSLVIAVILGATDFGLVKLLELVLNKSS